MNTATTENDDAYKLSETSAVLIDSPPTLTGPNVEHYKVKD